MNSKWEMEVSIITPVYNGLNFIDSAYESVYGQTFTDFEWIIIDDCSTDGSRKSLEELAAKHKKIKLLKHNVNQGPIVARNTGLTAARGRFIAFLDIDDCWDPAKLMKQIPFMEEQNAGLSYTGYSKISFDGSHISHRKIHIPQRINKHQILKTCSIMASSAVFDRSLTGDILQDTTAPFKDDLYLWVRILDMVGYAYGLTHCLSFLRVHNGSFTGNKLKEAGNQWAFYRKTLKFGFFKTLFYYSHYAIRGTLKYITLKYLS